AETAVKDLPADLRDPDAFATALQDAQKAAAALAQRFTAAVEALEAAKRAVSDASKDVTNLTGRLETAREDVSARAAEFDERLKVAGFASREELDAAALRAEDLAEREKD